MTTPVELLFVYGTLRPGGSNHFRMEGAERIAAGTTRGRLYRIDWYPGLVPDSNGEDVSGDVFAVEREQLSALDEFEGADYRRVRVKVVAASGEVVSAWVWEWLGEANEAKRIAGGDWLKEPEV